MSEQHKYDGGITGWWCRYEYPNGKQCGEHRGNTAVHLPAPVAECMHAPEMLDARLYVFEGQNFVSEKDYRAKQAQVERLILERDAALAGKSLTAISETPDGEVLAAAREAGRREGLYVASDLLRNNGVLLPIIVGETKQDRVVRFALAMADKIEALIDSPKAEGEETASRHGFHAACGTFHDLSICHVGSPAEAEGEESK